MTHSHDTSTPALSAETVPSEELKQSIANPFLPGGLGTRLLLAIQAYRKEYVYSTDDVDHIPTDWEAVLLEDFVAGIGGDDAFGEVVREATLSASHLAKEGGEAGTVERLKDAIEGECEGLAITDEQAAAILAHVSLPQPSPALAKGGDAVRLLPCPFCGGEPTLHPHSSDHMLGAWVSCSTCGLESPTETGQSVEAAVQHWNTRAALTTPSHQPADADALLSAAEQKAQGKRCACLGVDDWCPCQNTPDRKTVLERREKSRA